MPILAGIGILFLLLIVSVSAEAAAPRPPQTVVMYLDNITSYPSNYDIKGNLTWRLSPDDPDQTNGVFTYSLYQNSTNSGTMTCSATSGPAGSPSGCGWLRVNQTGYSPIAGRAGWVRIAVQFTVTNGGAICNTAYPGNCAFNMTAWNVSAGGIEGYASCNVNLTWTIGGSRDQCGAYITNSPAGIAAFTQAVSNETLQGNLQTKWPLSVNDTNNDTGDFRYRIIAHTTTETGQTIQILNDTDPVTVIDGNGIRIYNHTTGGTYRFTAQYQVRAEDPLTFMVSNFSCQSSVNSGLLNDMNSCNGVSLFTAIPSISETPLFPLVPNVIWTGQHAFGLEGETSTKWLFAAIWIGLLTGIGFWLLGLAGAGGGATISMGTAAIMGLIPFWIVVVVFALGLTAIVIFGSGRSGEA